MALYETVITSTASDDQEIVVVYNDGMCASIVIFDEESQDATMDVNENDLTAIINELTVVRDAIRRQKNPDPILETVDQSWADF